jgi:Na+-driven multidrug efflux pump
VFVLLGVVLETFHAFKWTGYLHVEHETRRLMLRLAHAHGTLLSVVQIVFALSARAEPRLLGSVRPAAMLLGQWMVPLGFLLGAIGARGGDPGPLVALLPAGAIAWLVLYLMLLAAVVTLRFRSGAWRSMQLVEPSAT